MKNCPPSCDPSNHEELSPSCDLSNHEELSPYFSLSPVSVPGGAGKKVPGVLRLTDAVEQRHFWVQIISKKRSDDGCFLKPVDFIIKSDSDKGKSGKNSDIL
jgi:hypothetical protein